MTNLPLQVDLIHREIEALKVRFPELEDDETLLADMIEGETNLHDVMAKLVARDRDARSFADAIKSQREALDARAARFKKQSEAMRSLMFRLLDAANTKKVMLPEASIGVRNVPPSVQITDEDNIPDDYAKFERRINKTALKEALKSGADIPGATMSNGYETLSIRYT